MGLWLPIWFFLYFKKGFWQGSEHRVLVVIIVLVISVLLLLQGLDLSFLLSKADQVLQVVVVASGTHNLDLRKPHRQRLPGSPLLQIPDEVRSVMCKRVAYRGWRLWIYEFGWFFEVFTDLCGFIRLQRHSLGAFLSSWFLDFFFLILWFCDECRYMYLCICRYTCVRFIHTPVLPVV